MGESLAVEPQWGAIGADDRHAASLPQAELLLGRLYYEGKLVPLDPKKAEGHLLNAAPTEPRRKSAAPRSGS